MFVCSLKFFNQRFRYRKYNLYGETGLTPPAQLEVVNFTIRNNVTFGIFTCFDILFDEPAMMLVRNGVRNILFPTMWFSQLPYLTGKKYGMFTLKCLIKIILSLSKSILVIRNVKNVLRMIPYHLVRFCSFIFTFIYLCHYYSNK